MDSEQGGPLSKKQKIDKALEEKELGNAAWTDMIELGSHNPVKEANIPKAIKHWYNVILLLKGLQIERFPMPGSPVNLSNGAVAPEDEAAQGQASKEPTGQKEDGAEREVDEKYSSKNIKKTLAACYVNMAICHAKKENWARCKGCAEDALKMEPENFKALFRLAQSTVRLGEISRGREMLIKLRAKGNDAAIDNELKVLDAAEKVREKKANDSLRGFINKANPTVPKISEITG